MPLSLVYVFEAPRCPARCPCLSRQLSVMAEELPSACQADRQVRTTICPEEARLRADDKKKHLHSLAPTAPPCC